MNILNAGEVEFDNVAIYFGKLCGEKHNKFGGLASVPERLSIARVLVIKNNTVKRSSFLSYLGLIKPKIKVAAELDIYLTDGTCLQVSTTDSCLITHLLKFVWELSAEPRTKIYKKMKHIELDKKLWDKTQI